MYLLNLSPQICMQINNIKMLSFWYVRRISLDFFYLMNHTLPIPEIRTCSLYIDISCSNQRVVFMIDLQYIIYLLLIKKI